MAGTSLAHTAHETQTPEYVLRGHGLFELHRDEILGNDQGAGKYSRPALSYPFGLSLRRYEVVTHRQPGSRTAC
jgi:hypothetical protein